MPINKIETFPREVDHVEYLSVKPRRSTIGLGYVTLNGNGFSGHDDLIKEAVERQLGLQVSDN
jgi:hypothetical protein